MKAFKNLVIMLCLIPAFGFAQQANENLDELLDLSLEDLMNLQITTATKTAGKLDAAPSVIDVITGEQIRQRGYQNLGQLLNDIANNHEDRSNWGIGEPTHQNVGFGFRFDTGQNILILFNGQRLNAFLPGNRFGGEEYLLNTIERIEIIRGAGSSLYGTGAFTAVINIISKTITGDEKEEIFVSADYIPTSNGFALNNALSIKVGNSGSITAGLRRFSETGQNLEVKNSLFGNRTLKDGVKEAIDGEFIFSNGAFNLFSKHTQQTRNTFTGFNGVNPADMKDLSLSMDATSAGMDYTIKTGSKSTIKLSGGWHTDLWEEIALIPQFKLNAEGNGLLYENGIPVLDTVALYRNGEFIETSFFIDGQSGRSQSLDGEIQYTVNYVKNNNLVLGIYLADDRVTKASRPSELNLFPLQFVPFRSIDDPANNWLLDLKASRQTWAAFGQIDYQVTKNLSVIAGLRMDNYSGHGILTEQKYSEVNPRFSMVYDADNIGAIKAIFGTATRIPNGFETLSAVSILGNPSNRPERNRMYQMQWINSWGNNWRTELGLFRAEITNRLETNAEISDELKAQGFIGQFVNVGTDLKQVNNGIDARIATRVSNSTLMITATQYFGGDNGRREEIAYIPKTMVNLDYTLPFGIVDLNVGLNYRGSFTKSSADPRKPIKDYIIGRINLIVTPTTIPFQFKLTARNLFNTDYRYPSSSLDFYDQFPARKFELQITLAYTPSIK
jgi:outer membrane receptor for ferrienterochelin and colicins